MVGGHAEAVTVNILIGNSANLPEVVRMEDLEAAIDEVVCDVYDSDGWGVSKAELYRILEELPKFPIMCFYNLQY